VDTPPGPLLVGTAGYSYSDWEGTLYPPGTARGAYLGLYAARFPVVELNFSYYTQPAARTLEGMLRGTPRDFLFSIKAHRSLTHEPGEDLEAQVRRYREGIAPLVEAGRLAAILFQFPHSFHYTPDSRRHLSRLCEAFQELPKAVEFRGAEWQRPSVYEGLRRWNAAFVNVDTPRLPRLPEPGEEATADLGYVRLHGRNRANWWQGDNASRYDYLYSPEELEEWLPRIARLLAKVRIALVIFNNHPGGKAVRNALELAALLGSPRPDPGVPGPQ
jgi:uncharacterized protein YecE (DUF72 family)